MKKKGFTLVELLAVIAILAILVIIALPNVLGMFNSAKKNTFVTEVESIYKQAQTDFINDSLQQAGARKYCQSGNGYTVSCADGALELTTTKAYLIEMDSQGNVTYLAVADNSFVYGNAGVASINEISGDDVKDASDATYKDKFELKSGTATSGKVNTTAP